MAAEPVSAGVSALAAVAPARNKQGAAQDARATGFGSALASWSEAPDAPPVDVASRKDDDARDTASSAGNPLPTDPNATATAATPPTPPLDGAALLAQATLVARDAAAGKSDAPTSTAAASTGAITAMESAVDPGRAPPRGLPISAAEARAAATAQAAATAAAAAVDGASADATAALDAAQALAATAGAATTQTDASAQAQAEATTPGTSRSVLREPTPPRVTSRVTIAPIDSNAASASTPAATAAASWQRQVQTANAQARSADAAQGAEPRLANAAQNAAAADVKAASTAQLQQQPMQVSPEASATAAAEAMLQGALAATTASARRTERGDERSTTSGLPMPVGDAAMGHGGPGAALIPTVDASAAAAAAAAYADPLSNRLIEQMSMWLSQKTQSAQLTLDVPGGSPVSVNIHVQGNEAQIAFRSDQPEARQLLTQSLPQLKDMLGAEGLMLSGASVGGGQNQDGKATADTQFGNAKFGNATNTGDAALSALAAPVRRVTQGRLDLYV